MKKGLYLIFTLVIFIIAMTIQLSSCQEDDDDVQTSMEGQEVDREVRAAFNRHHFVSSKSRSAARENARKASKGRTPIEDKAHKGEGFKPHFHPVNNKGGKVDNGVHYTFPGRHTTYKENKGKNQANRPGAGRGKGHGGGRYIGGGSKANGGLERNGGYRKNGRVQNKKVTTKTRKDYSKKQDSDSRNKKRKGFIRPRPKAGGTF